MTRKSPRARGGLNPAPPAAGVLEGTGTGLASVGSAAVGRSREVFRHSWACRFRRAEPWGSRPHGRSPDGRRSFAPTCQKIHSLRHNG